MRLVYLSHPESLIDPGLPVPDWGLSPRGLARATWLGRNWPFGPASLWFSPERKARDCAEILAFHSGCPAQLLPGSGEIDRSATGYLPADEHEALAGQAFGQPDQSARGWETARDAQARILAALACVPADPGRVTVLVGHGGVGTLLYCALAGLAIARGHDQPRQGCGWIAEGAARHAWQPFEGLAAGQASSTR